MADVFLALARSVSLVLTLASPGPTPDGSAAAAAWRAQGLALGYNLDHAEALQAFDAAIAADPGDPRNYCLAAGAAWISLLFSQGAITMEDYLGQAKSRGRRPNPDADLDAAFHRYLNEAIARSEQQVRDRPLDAEAHYQVGTAYGFLASYTATVQGSVFGSLGPGRRAYQEHERALQLDPSRRDAGLIVGLYRYTVASLPLPARLVAKLAGVRGSRESGLRLVEEAARFPSAVQANAKFTLILIYTREARYADALQVIDGLQSQFPRNRLLWLEAVNAHLRAGETASARAALDVARTRLAADLRPRAPGEAARWDAVGKRLDELQATRRR